MSRVAPRQFSRCDRRSLTWLSPSLKEAAGEANRLVIRSDCTVSAQSRRYAVRKHGGRASYGSELEERGLAGVAGDSRPGQVVHEHPCAPVDGRRAPPLQGRLVAGTRIALVELEVVAREVL